MKKILITSLVLCSCACYASVSKGRGDTYHVDQNGSEFDGKKKVQFMEQAKSLSVESFKSSSPLALY